MSRSEMEQLAEQLAEAIRVDLRAMEGRLNDRIDGAMAAVRDELHEVAGGLTVKVERLTSLTEGSVAASARCFEKIMVVEMDTRALTDRFLPKAENERRHRAAEKAIEDLAKARDEVRGRVDDIEHQLRVVQSRGP